MTTISTADLSLASGARFSGCRHYRPVLWRSWAPERGAVVFIGLNPSTADAASDDPTIRRCRRFSADWGYGAMLMVNLFDARATHPVDLKRKRAPVSRMNDSAVLAACASAGLVVAAWGGHGRHRARSDAMRDVLKVAGVRPVCFGIGASGEPLHPLYQRRDRVPELPLFRA